MSEDSPPRNRNTKTYSRKFARGECALDYSNGWQTDTTDEEQVPDPSAGTLLFSLRTKPAAGTGKEISPLIILSIF